MLLRDMIDTAKRNLKHESIKNLELIKVDARECYLVAKTVEQRKHCIAAYGAASELILLKRGN